MPSPTLVEFTPDARRGCLKRSQLTLSATPGTATTIVVPTDAKGFGIYPAAAIIDFNVNAAIESLTAVATTDQDAVASDEFNGNYAMPAQWNYFLLEDYNATSNATRTLYVSSLTASAVLYVVFF